MIRKSLTAVRSIRSLVVAAITALTFLMTAHAVGSDPKMVKMTTNKGVIEIELFANEAPKSVANFLSYVESGFYDGLIFHRVIPGFMVQGGGFEPGMTQKKTNDQIENEADNGLKNEIGTLAMARTGDPHSATAQFFINVSDNEFLNFKAKNQQGWGYAVFGKVTSGMDVVEQITGVETGSSGPFQDVPKDDVIIEKAEVIK